MLRRKLVVTERYDAVGRTGPVAPRLTVAAIDSDGVSIHDFAAFLASLRIRIEESELSEQVVVRRDSSVQAEIRLIDANRAGMTWRRLAQLIAEV